MDEDDKDSVIVSESDSNSSDDEEIYQLPIETQDHLEPPNTVPFSKTSSRVVDYTQETFEEKVEAQIKPDRFKTAAMSAKLKLLSAVHSTISSVKSKKLGNSVFARRQVPLRVMTLNSDSSSSTIEDMTLANILLSVTKYKKVVTVLSQAENIRNDGIHSLRSRDLCLVTKSSGVDGDVPMIVVRQHACLISLRHDMRAIIQSDRVLFVAEKVCAASVQFCMMSTIFSLLSCQLYFIGSRYRATLTAKAYES